MLLGCQRLADYLEGVKKNYDSAAQVLKHNCETHGHGESCYKLGAYHVTGKGGYLTSLFIFSEVLNTKHYTEGFEFLLDFYIYPTTFQCEIKILCHFILFKLRFYKKSSWKGNQ